VLGWGDLRVVGCGGSPSSTERGSGGQGAAAPLRRDEQAVKRVVLVRHGQSPPLPKQTHELICFFFRLQIHELICFLFFPDLLACWIKPQVPSFFSPTSQIQPVRSGLG